MIAGALSVVRVRRFFRSLIVLLLSMHLAGCTALAYYTQATFGHAKLTFSKQSLADAIDDSDSNTARQLRMVEPVLKFAINRIGLPATKSYKTYVALPQPYPVYNVIAAPKDSLEPWQWCYLVIGCASYRGYFSEQAALDYAEKLRNEHDLETHVGGAIAYSTLGWFADPVLSSMLKYGDLFLVELLIHELTHQKLYVNNATDFNEAFATFVAEQATREWVTQSDPAKLVGYEHSQLRRAEFDQLIERHKRRLQAEYDQGALPEELELKKRNLERMLKVEYQQLKAGSWNGFEGYDGWFDQPINNARLAAFSTYRKLVPEFRRVFETCNQDFARFFNAIETNLDNDNQGLVALLNQGVLDCE